MHLPIYSRMSWSGMRQYRANNCISFLVYRRNWVCVKYAVLVLKVSSSVLMDSCFAKLSLLIQFLFKCSEICNRDKVVFLELEKNFKYYLCKLQSSKANWECAREKFRVTEPICVNSFTVLQISSWMLYCWL